MENMNDSLNILKRILIYENPILFTGAGFSLGAKQSNGKSIPSGKQLKNDIIVNLLKYSDKTEEYNELQDANLADICEMCDTDPPVMYFNEYVLFAVPY